MPAASRPANIFSKAGESQPAEPNRLERSCRACDYLVCRHQHGVADAAPDGNGTICFRRNCKLEAVRTAAVTGIAHIFTIDVGKNTANAALIAINIQADGSLRRGNILRPAGDDLRGELVDIAT